MVFLANDHLLYLWVMVSDQSNRLNLDIRIFKCLSVHHSVYVSITNDDLGVALRPKQDWIRCAQEYYDLVSHFCLLWHPPYSAVIEETECTAVGGDFHCCLEVEPFRSVLNWTIEGSPGSLHPGTDRVIPSVNIVQRNEVSPCHPISRLIFVSYQGVDERSPISSSISL